MYTIQRDFCKKRMPAFAGTLETSYGLVTTRTHFQLCRRSVTGRILYSWSHLSRKNTTVGGAFHQNAAAAATGTKMSHMLTRFILALNARVPARRG